MSFDVSMIVMRTRRICQVIISSQPEPNAYELIGVIWMLNYELLNLIVQHVYLDIFRTRRTWKSFSSKLLMFSRQKLGSLCIGDQSR